MLIQILITIGASQALALAMLNLLKKQPSQADYLLSLKLILMFFVIILFNYHRELEVSNVNFVHHPYLLGYLIVPIFYLYTKVVSQGAVSLKSWINLKHLIPFILMVAIVASNFYVLSYPEKLIAYDQIDNGIAPFWHQLMYYGLFFGMFPFYLFKSFRLLQKHENYILTKFSYTENISLAWLNRFFWCIGIVWVVFVFFAVIPNVFFGGHHHSQYQGFQFGFIILIINIFYVGIYGLKQKIIFFEETSSPISSTEEDPLIPTANKYQHSNLTKKQANLYLKDLTVFMEQKKPYLEPKITIAELSYRTNIPINHLSQIINEKLEQNFFDFINSYRVEAFKQLIQNPNYQEYTILGLAYEAGFNSKSTFNAIFKKFTGQTPSGYAKQIKLRTITSS